MPKRPAPLEAEDGPGKPPEPPKPPPQPPGPGDPPKEVEKALLV